MNKISELKHILDESFAWNKTRLDCFARILIALFAVRTVNLSELAVAFASKATVRSRYIRKPLRNMSWSSSCNGQHTLK